MGHRHIYQYSERLQLRDKVALGISRLVARFVNKVLFWSDSGLMSVSPPRRSPPLNIDDLLGDSDYD